MLKITNPVLIMVDAYFPDNKRIGPYNEIHVWGTRFDRVARYKRANRLKFVCTGEIRALLSRSECDNVQLECLFYQIPN